mmetsp:Transcript_35310/g.70201  ORF Transcript_35310/g.70201 Transcript_35310/m.70201 type:complete len:216 (-) Transcript_35310:144-791(-)|eukprot:CAMPEP_0170212350 /NCGR_PEP_ID=MMETSP0116_2-20130129/5793_1 /TAXON_ID=400756 /ORGANISM="Durinskia baltica, Strain CSIRO CS-38" /LENGTH=215 /DNA_ID=CAMNT_0010462889 /DNA_START=107 /DNA_END=754 /DNA_ORIENTATION=-
MEVASPLSFVPNSAGPKRHLPCSPSFVDTSLNPFDSSDDYMQHRSFKRRRFNMDVSMEGDSENSVNHVSLPVHHNQQQKTVFGTPYVHSSFKRCRSEVSSPQHDLQKVVESQASEIATLKHEKTNLESSLNSLRSEHDKVVHENRILKKAVTIQQERQNQAASEIEVARRFKFDAEDRIKKLEQIIMSLRYHLQTQQSMPTNDFMGFPPRPPDVY